MSSPQIFPTLRHVFLYGLLWLCCAPRVGFADTAETTPDWVQIELVAFAPKQDASPQVSGPLSQFSTPLPSNWRSLSRDPDAAAGPFVALAAAELALNDSVKRLKSHGYRILLHTAWRQPATDGTNQTPVFFQYQPIRDWLAPIAPQQHTEANTGNNGVEGVRGEEIMNTPPDPNSPVLLQGVLSTEKVRHHYLLRLNLHYTQAIGTVRLSDSDIDNAQAGFTGYSTRRLYQEQRANYGKLNYFDDAHIGVIVKLSRVPKEALAQLSR